MKFALALIALAAVIAAVRFRPPGAQPPALQPVAARSPDSQPQDARLPAGRDRSTAAYSASSASSPAAPAQRFHDAMGHAAAAPVVVYVAGAVAHPGLVTVPPDARVDAAVRRAVPLPNADLVAVNLAAHAVDGEEIAVPRIGDPATKAAVRAGRTRTATAPAVTARTHRRTKRAAHGARAAAEPPAIVDLNTADAQTLATLPGVGARLAERIVAFREANGPFDAVDDLSDVAGVSDRALDALAPYVRVGK